MGLLFPRLPDEIGRECLVRVELNSHHNLRSVCKSWNAALKSPSFYERRKVLKISEQRICFIKEFLDEFEGVAVYDPEMNSYKSLPPLPIEFDCDFRSHFVKQKLVLIPDNLDLEPTENHVWLYDFVGLKWKQGAKMTRWMNRFASATDEHGGLIYVAGGYMFGDPISSASVYNVEEDKWEDLPDMNSYMGFFPQGVFSDGKFYVMQSLECFEVFDSYRRSWRSMKNNFNMEKTSFGGRYVSAFGNIYYFSANGRLIEYDCCQNKVQVLGSLPGIDSDRFVVFAITVGNKIFVRKCDDTLGFCMLTLPSETGGAFKWIDIQNPPDLEGLSTRGAATLDL